MPERLNLEGAPFALLLVFGESFLAAMATEHWFSETLKIWIVLIHITDARGGRYMILRVVYTRG
jgi:hypothetical protein